MVHEIFAAELITPRPLLGHVNGLPELRELVSPYKPEAVAEGCGVEAELIRRLAHELAAAPSAAVYGRIGTTTVRHGTGG